MNEKTEMMADMIKKLACLLIEQNDKLTLEQALATVFNSEIYGKVMNERTSFYTQSPRYVFSFLDEELKKWETWLVKHIKLHGRFFIDGGQCNCQPRQQFD